MFHSWPIYFSIQKAKRKLYEKYRKIQQQQHCKNNNNNNKNADAHVIINLIRTSCNE